MGKHTYSKLERHWCHPIAFPYNHSSVIGTGMNSRSKRYQQIPFLGFLNLGSEGEKNKSLVSLMVKLELITQQMGFLQSEKMKQEGEVWACVVEAEGGKERLLCPRHRARAWPYIQQNPPPTLSFRNV